jgi:hypothetical protein
MHNSPEMFHVTHEIRTKLWHRTPNATGKIPAATKAEQASKSERARGAGREQPYLSAMRRNALLISGSVALRLTPSTSYGSLLCAAPPDAVEAADSPFSDLNEPNLHPAMPSPPPPPRPSTKVEGPHTAPRVLGSRVPSRGPTAAAELGLQRPAHGPPPAALAAASSRRGSEAAGETGGRS